MVIGLGYDLFLCFLKKFLSFSFFVIQLLIGNWLLVLSATHIHRLSHISYTLLFKY